MKDFQFIPVEHARYNYKLNQNLKNFSGNNGFEKKYATLLRLLMKQIQRKSCAGLGYCAFSNSELFPRIRRHLVFDVKKLHDDNIELAKRMRTQRYQVESEDYETCLAKINHNKTLIREAYDDVFHVLVQYLQLQGYKVHVDFHKSTNHIVPVSFTLYIHWEMPPYVVPVYTGNDSNALNPATGL